MSMLTDFSVADRPRARSPRHTKEGFPLPSV
jgi:hypothetical protein